MNALSSPPATPIWADSDVNKALARLADTAASRRAQTIAGAIHRGTLEEKLVSAFVGARLAATGSNRTLTGVAGHSDEDYFAIIPAHLLKADSQASLDDLGAALRERFPRTAIRVDRPCVRVPFDDGTETIEITPVAHMGYTLLGFPQFLIPDGTGGWEPSAPESHNAYVHDIDIAFGGDVRRLIVLAKIWKYERNVAIRSFFIEITCALHACSLYARGVRRIDLAADLRAWLDIQKRCALDRSQVSPRRPDD
ncbi:MAG TPA: hypothetical protein DHW63_09945 [Hyphomonadaceae bacterium]|nr:hypothetical protein [Hyphomonadaceae bacterium]